MTDHLSDDDFSGVLIGERRRDVETHLGECLACRAEAERLRGILGQFRTSVREWSGQYPARVTIPHRRRASRLWISMGGLGWATAALIGCFLVRPSVERDAQPFVEPSDKTSDAALVFEVDQQTARTVPRSMEPLLSLLSWQKDSDSGATEGVREVVQ